MKARCSSFLFVFLLFFSFSSSAQVQFASPDVYYTEYSSEMKVADLNRDGRTDVVVIQPVAVGYQRSGKVYAYLNDGGGGLKSPAVYQIPEAPLRLFVSDFDNDGAIDAAITATTPASDDVLIIMKGDGSGNLTRSAVVPLPDSGAFVATGDFNNDNRRDVAVMGFSGDMEILTNSPEGFSAKRVAASRAYAANRDRTESLKNLVAGDFNGDGNMDLAYADECTDCSPKVSRLWVLFNNGQTEFTAAQIGPEKPGHTALISSDFDGDGVSDLAYSHAGCSTVCGAIELLYVNRDRTTVLQTVATGRAAIVMLADDFNNDGILDLVSPEFSNSGLTHTIRIWTGKGSRAGFNTDQAIADVNAGAVYGYWDIASGFLDANGTKDIIRLRGSAITTYMNQTPFPDSCRYPTEADLMLCTPANGGVGGSSHVRVKARYHALAYPANRMEVWLDGQKKFQIFGDTLDFTVPMNSGNHTLTVVGVDVTGQLVKKHTSFSTGDPNGECVSPTTAGVRICKPGPNVTSGMPWQVVASASAPEGKTVTAMRVYVDNVARHTAYASYMNVTLPAFSNGRHLLAVVAYYSDGTAARTSQYVTVSECVPDSPGAQICSPVANTTTIGSYITVKAGARATFGNIVAMRIYLNDQAVNTTMNSPTGPTQQLSTTLNVSPGTHRMTVVGYQSDGGFVRSSISFTVDQNVLVVRGGR